MVIFLTQTHPVKIKLLFCHRGFLIQYYLESHIYNGGGSRASNEFCFINSDCASWPVNPWLLVHTGFPICLYSWAQYKQSEVSGANPASPGLSNRSYHGINSPKSLEEDDALRWCLFKSLNNVSGGNVWNDLLVGRNKFNHTIYLFINKEF